MGSEDGIVDSGYAGRHPRSARRVQGEDGCDTRSRDNRAKMANEKAKTAGDGWGGNAGRKETGFVVTGPARGETRCGTGCSYSPSEAGGDVRVLIRSSDGFATNRFLSTWRIARPLDLMPELVDHGTEGRYNLEITFRVDTFQRSPQPVLADRLPHFHSPGERRNPEFSRFDGDRAGMRENRNGATFTHIDVVSPPDVHQSSGGSTRALPTRRRGNPYEGTGRDCSGSPPASGHPR